MTEENIDILIREKGIGKILPEKGRFETIRKKARLLDDSALPELMSVPYKSVVATALLSVFLGNFGAARFYLGEKKEGLTRLLTVIGVPLLCMVFLFLPFLGIRIFEFLSRIYSLVFILWWIFDIVACVDGVREYNYWRLVSKIDKLNGAGIA